MDKKVMDEINEDIEAALSDISDLENIVENNLPNEELKEKFRMLSLKVSNLESLLMQEGIL
ncbi:MAG: hypothetical protein GX829_01290 [Clostridium sp.]|jgi:hypothetical protein|nr:hypothetical protein [Clostridium sp.]